MSSRILSVSARSALYLTLGIAGAIAAPAACLFPSYTFTEPEPTGTSGAGGAPATTSASQSASSAGGSMVTATASSSSSAAASGSGGAGGAGGDMSTASASSSAASTTAASSSSTGMVMPEDCTDGIDNDLDGKIDCADTDCQVGFSCHNPLTATLIQDGWTGHYALADGAVAALPGNCPGATYPNPIYTGYRAPSAPAAMCSSCTCDAPLGEVCEVDIHVAAATCAQYNMGKACTTITGLPSTANGVCEQSVGGFAGGDATCSLPVAGQCPAGTAACNQAIIADAALLVGGSCNPSTQVPTVPPFAWNSAGRACQPAAEGKGCASSFACLPNAPAPFGAICISHVGDVACPPVTAGYTTKKTYFDLDPIDDRTCSDCACSGVNGASCTKSVDVYSDPVNGQCNTKIATVLPGGCADITGNPTVYGRKGVSTQITPGSCSPSGGQAMGSTSGVNAVTFCCQ